MRGQKQRFGAPNHVARFFGLVARPSIDFLTSALLHIEFPGIRRWGLKAMQSAYYYTSPDRAFSLPDFSRIFGLDEERIVGFCEYHGLEGNGAGGIMVGRMKNVDQEGARRNDIFNCPQDE